MNELVERVSTTAGIEPEAASTAIGLILNFLTREGPESEVNAVIEKIPGAREALSNAAVAEEGDAIAGISSGGGGLMGLAAQLSGLGLSMGEMQTVGREVLAFAREKAGEDAVSNIVEAIPGMHQLM